MSDPAGVVLARDEGLIVVLDAVPIPAEMQQQLDAICDLLGAPQRHEMENREP